MGGVGRFDSVGGTYDHQTSLSFFKTLYYQTRARSIIGPLSTAGKGGSSNVEEMRAGLDAGSLDGSAVIRRQKITEGDAFRMTIQEHIVGGPTYGDRGPANGDFLAFKNMDARINTIHSPRVPVTGKMSMQRIKASIQDMPGETKKEVIDWAAEQMEIELLQALNLGASPSVLDLGAALGVGTTGVAGRPLMTPNWFSGAADVTYGGKQVYSTTPATWNGKINSAINALTNSATDYITLADLKIIRSMMDDLRFPKNMAGGKAYKAIALTDPELWYRIDHLLGAYYQTSKPREGSTNPIFDVDHQLSFDGILFLNVPNLKKLRPAYNSASSVYGPKFGPGCKADSGVDGDIRNYTNTSPAALIHFVSAGAIVEGYNDAIEITTEEYPHNTGMDVASHLMEGYVPSVWYPKDGRDVAPYCNNIISAVWYEPGVGTGY